MNNEPTITKVDPLRVEIARPKREHIKTRKAEPLPVETWRDDTQDLTTWERGKLYARLTWVGIKSIPLLFTITREGGMFASKTTVAGIIKTIFMLLSMLGISTGHVTEAVVTAFVWGIVEIYQAVVTPDKPKE